MSSDNSLPMFRDKWAVS